MQELICRSQVIVNLLAVHRYKYWMVDPSDIQESTSLPELIRGTTKLADLKKLVAWHDEFKILRKSLEKYTGLGGPRELKAAMYRALGV